MKLLINHSDFIVVEKPANIDFHNDEGKKGFFTLVLQWCQEENISDRLFPVHRLDKVTSGLIIFAKSKEAATTFGKLFEEHQIEKYYLALSNKKPKKKQGTIIGDMERSRRGSWKLLPTKTNPAQTQFFSYGLGAGIRLFLLRPLTGKTHQLRVALKSIGSPIIGDPIYQSREEALQADRTYLHAVLLRFSYAEKEYTLTSFPTSGLLWPTKELLPKEIETPWELHWPKVKRFQ